MGTGRGVGGIGTGRGTGGAGTTRGARAIGEARVTGNAETAECTGPSGRAKPDDVARAGESPARPVEPPGEPSGDMSAAGPGVAEISESTELPVSRAR